MLGYDISARILLNVSDWSQATMITAGNWDKKSPEFSREERPWVTAQQNKKKDAGMDIGDLYKIFAAKAERQGS